MESVEGESLSELPKDCQKSFKDLSESDMTRHAIQSNCLQNNGVKTPISMLDYHTIRTDRDHMNDLVQVTRGQADHLTFPVSEEDLRSSTPFHVSVIDSQVIQITCKSLGSSGRKQRTVDLNRSKEEEISSHMAVKKKHEVKSHTFITSSEKTCILPHVMSSDGDYMLTEGVLCEDILPSGDMLPEEQILTIPSPSPVEFGNGAKPDVLAIAASEVFSDSCISLPLHENKCVSDLIEYQISVPKLNSVVEENVSCEFTSGSLKPERDPSESSPSHLVCDTVTGLTCQLMDKESKKLKARQISLAEKNILGDCENRTEQKRCEIDIKGDNSEIPDTTQSKPSNWHAVPASIPQSSNSNINSLPVIAGEPVLNVNTRQSDVADQGDNSPIKSMKNLPYLCMENSSHRDSSQADGSSEERIPSAESSLRRSSRISKCKKDPGFVSCSSVYFHISCFFVKRMQTRS